MIFLGNVFKGWDAATISARPPQAQNFYPSNKNKAKQKSKVPAQERFFSKSSFTAPQTEDDIKSDLRSNYKRENRIAHAKSLKNE